MTETAQHTNTNSNGQ